MKKLTKAQILKMHSLLIQKTDRKDSLHSHYEIFFLCIVYSFVILGAERN